MARGDNLSYEDRAKGGHNSHAGRSKTSGSKGGRSSKRGLASASQETRKRVASEGGSA